MTDTRRDGRAAADRESSALARTRRRSQRRLARTIVLGTVAVFAGIAWLATELGMDAGELTGYAVTSALLILVMVLLALAGAALLRLLKKLLGRR